MAAHGKFKFKAKIDAIHVQFFGSLKPFFHLLTKELKLRLYLQNLMSV